MIVVLSPKQQATMKAKSRTTPELTCSRRGTAVLELAYALALILGLAMLLAVEPVGWMLPMGLAIFPFAGFAGQRLLSELALTERRRQ